MNYKLTNIDTADRGEIIISTVKNGRGEWAAQANLFYSRKQAVDAFRAEWFRNSHDVECPTTLEDLLADDDERHATHSEIITNAQFVDQFERWSDVPDVMRAAEKIEWVSEIDAAE